MPPLRERTEDIPDLIRLFAKRFSREMTKPTVNFSSEALIKLSSHKWPGNIRELKNYIERLVAFHNQDKPVSVNELSLSQERTKISYPSELFKLSYEDAKNSLLNDFKRTYFKRALDLNNGNISATAEILGINRSAFHKMLKKIGI